MEVPQVEGYVITGQYDKKICRSRDTYWDQRSYRDEEIRSADPYVGDL